MIVKIDDPGGDWVMFDNVTRLYKNSLEYHDGESDKMVEYTRYFFMAPLDSNPEPACKLSLWRRVSEHVEEFAEVWFNTAAYVCNDNGKTIERICVRYPLSPCSK